MSAQLAQAAQAVIDRWDSPKWEWTKQGPTADLIADLRKELAAFEAAPQQEPVAWVDERAIAWLEGRSKSASITTPLQAHKSAERPMPLYAAPQQAQAPGWQLVPEKITEEQHVAACKVLLRANGLDGLPQRMLDAIRAAAPQQGSKS